jgi:lipopolysaccharide transport system permease protein
MADDPAPPASGADASVPGSEEWTIEPRTSGAGARVREVWAYRRLVRFFASRTVAKLYQKTILGRAWLFIRPLFPLLVKTLVFGGLLGVSFEGVPYFLGLLVGTTVWDFFASALMWATRGLELNRGLIEKVYVPRVILPLANMAPGLLNLAIYVGVIAASLLYYLAVDGRLYLGSPSHLPLALLAAALAGVLAFAIGLFTSVLGAAARDVRFTLAYVLDFWALLSPVMYPLTAVPAEWRPLMLLNPMAAFVETFKFGVLGVGQLDLRALAIASAVTAATLAAGLWFFGRAEAEAVDRV